MAYNKRGYGMTTRYAVGDPFLGGLIKGAGKFLGGVAKTVGGIVPGPVGGVLSTVGGLITGGGGGAAPATSIRPISITGGLPTFPGSPMMNVTLPQQQYAPGFPAAGAMGAAVGAYQPKGYHLNKSGYFLKTGQYVAPGTKWVRNRRTNPANGRALRRAISRTSQFNNTVKRARKNLRALAKV